MFVISIKRVKTYQGVVLNENEQYWEYAMFDRYMGSFSTGLPRFGDLKHAEMFDTVEEARLWYFENSKDIFRIVDSDKYDIDTLAIRECLFTVVEKL